METREKIRWGILGTGDIAGQFAQDLQLLPDAELQAVGSRSKRSAEAFGHRYGAAQWVEGYETLAEADAVDIVYVASPHPWHREHAELCLSRGKAVLCEKPLAVNAEQAASMIQAAGNHQRFLMEAMWTFFFPAYAKVKALLDDGAIGSVRMLHATFCFSIPLDPTFRLFKPELGGGALLDVGVYTMGLAHWVFGSEPDSMLSAAHLGETGVDEHNALILRYPHGAMAVLQSASRASMPQTAVVSGTEGSIELPRFSQPDQVILTRGNKQETFTFDRIGLGLAFEARHVMDCLRAGRTQSDIVSWNDSLAVMRMMDQARHCWGLRYPGETVS